jgi:hypothetical protein
MCALQITKAFLPSKARLGRVPHRPFKFDHVTFLSYCALKRKKKSRFEFRSLVSLLEEREITADRSLLQSKQIALPG